MLDDLIEQSTSVKMIGGSTDTGEIRDKLDRQIGTSKSDEKILKGFNNKILSFVNKDDRK